MLYVATDISIRDSKLFMGVSTYDSVLDSFTAYASKVDDVATDSTKGELIALSKAIEYYNASRKAVFFTDQEWLVKYIHGNRTKYVVGIYKNNKQIADTIIKSKVTIKYQKSHETTNASIGAWLHSLADFMAARPEVIKDSSVETSLCHRLGRLPEEVKVKEEFSVFDRVALALSNIPVFM